MSISPELGQLGPTIQLHVLDRWNVLVTKDLQCWPATAVGAWDMGEVGDDQTVGVCSVALQAD